MTDHEYIKYAQKEFGIDVIFWGSDCKKTTSGRHILEDRKIDFWCCRCDTSFDKRDVIRNPNSVAERKATAKMTLAIMVGEFIDLMEWPGNQREQWKNYSMRVAQSSDLSLDEYAAAIKSFDRQIEFARRLKTDGDSA